MNRAMIAISTLLFAAMVLAQLCLPTSMIRTTWWLAIESIVSLVIFVTCLINLVWWFQQSQKDRD